ncbi:MAG: bifunctional metallophosphatase/5'-nucleotidase [Candidatus Hydrogenedentota bacterium]
MKHESKLLRPTLVILLLSLVAAGAAAGADTDSLLIVYTNDIHDHLRSDYDGRGGFVHVAAYIKQVRTQRNDVLVVDAGDITEKGDMVSHVSGGRAACELFARTGYDAVVPGNHDVRNLDKLRAFLEDPGLPLVCANMLVDGKSLLPPKRVVEVNGLRVGIIGLTRFAKRAEVLDAEGSTRALAEQAATLEPETDLLVALVHEGTKVCGDLARAVPVIDVFVSGHTHQLVQEPHRVEETGALIVQAGSNAEYVGRLELTVDKTAKAVVEAKGDLIPMEHDAIPADAELAAWLESETARIAPEAATLVAHSQEPIGRDGVAWLIAEALRTHTGADVGLCMADKVIRNSLPAGEIDGNAVFRVFAPWAIETVAVDIAGAALVDYLEKYAFTWDRPAWSGFAARMDRDDNRNVHVGNTTLEPDTTYRVALSKEEWEDRLSDHCDAKPQPIAGNAFDALLAYIKKEAGGAPLDQHATKLGEAATAAGRFASAVHH